MLDYLVLGWVPSLTEERHQILSDLIAVVSVVRLLAKV